MVQAGCLTPGGGVRAARQCQLPTSRIAWAGELGGSDTPRPSALRAAHLGKHRSFLVAQPPREGGTHDADRAVCGEADGGALAGREGVEPRTGPWSLHAHNPTTTLRGSCVQGWAQPDVQSGFRREGTRSLSLPLAGSGTGDSQEGSRVSRELRERDQSFAPQ